jgi:hypothetical protein
MVLDEEVTLAPFQYLSPFKVSEKKNLSPRTAAAVTRSVGTVAMNVENVPSVVALRFPPELEIKYRVPFESGNSQRPEDGSVE